LAERANPSDERWSVWRYRTFEDLQARMAELIGKGGFDVVIHCAAVSDYLLMAFMLSRKEHFEEQTGRWQGKCQPARQARR